MTAETLSAVWAADTHGHFSWMWERNGHTGAWRGWGTGQASSERKRCWLWWAVIHLLYIRYPYAVTLRVPVGSGTLPVCRLNGGSWQHCGVPERQAVPVSPPSTVHIGQRKEQCSFRCSRASQATPGFKDICGSVVAPLQRCLWRPGEASACWFLAQLAPTGGWGRAPGGTVTCACGPEEASGSGRGKAEE